MQGSGGAFGKRDNPRERVDVKDIYSKILSNFENVEINRKNINTLKSLLAALDIQTRFTNNRDALSDLSLGLGLVGVTVETLQTLFDALDIETRFTHNLNALVDLSLGLGFVGATIETLQNNLDALYNNIETQLKTVNANVSGNSTAIITLGENTETRFTQYTEALGDLSLGLGLLGTHNRNALSDLSLGLGLVGVTVETLQTNVASNI